MSYPINYKGFEFTADHVKEMREWVTDCQWNEGEDYINSLSDIAIIRGVERHYCGGLLEFIEVYNDYQNQLKQILLCKHKSI